MSINRSPTARLLSGAKTYKLTSNGATATRSLKKGEIVGKSHNKNNDTGSPDKDYVITNFGSFINHDDKNPNSILSYNSKDKNLYLRTNRPIKQGEALSVNFNSLKMLGKLQKERPTDFTNKIKPEFSTQGNLEIDGASTPPGQYSTRSY